MVRFAYACLSAVMTPQKKGDHALDLKDGYHLCEVGGFVIRKKESHDVCDVELVYPAKLNSEFDGLRDEQLRT